MAATSELANVKAPNFMLISWTMVAGCTLLYNCLCFGRDLERLKVLMIPLLVPFESPDNFIEDRELGHGTLCAELARETLHLFN